MKWSHLPVAGGLYDQDPKLIDDWTFIMGEEGRERKRRQDIEERKMKPASGRSGRSRGRGR